MSREQAHGVAGRRPAAIAFRAQTASDGKLSLVAMEVLA